jgi:hypothetical protein
MGKPKPGNRDAWLFIGFLIILFITATFVIEYVSNPRFSNAVNAMIMKTRYAWLRIELGVAKPMQLEPPAQQPLMLSTAYVIGPASFASSLDVSPQSSVREIGLDQVPQLPNGSVLVIDWDYVNQSLRVGLRRLADVLEGPMGRGDFVMLYTANPKLVTLLENVVAVAWGDERHSKVIGYPVMAVNGPAYIVGFGGVNYLIASPVQIRDYYTATINGLINEWAGQAKAASRILILNFTSDPTYINQDPCGETKLQINGNSNVFMFGTGEQIIVASGDVSTGDQYSIDYCIITANGPVGDTIYTDYMGFNNIQVASSNSYGNTGEFRYYNVGINMTTALSIDSENGYNSYMTWSGSYEAAEPSDTSCSWFSYSDLELAISLAQETLEYLFEAATASDPSQPIASLVSSLTITGPGNDGTSNLVWSIGLENPYLFCSPESTRTGGIYPIGFGLIDGQGDWQVNPSVINTAASPVYFGRGVICYPLTNGYVEEAFGGSVYFVLQYNPSGSPQISQVSTQYPTPIYAVDFATPDCP